MANKSNRVLGILVVAVLATLAVHRGDAREAFAVSEISASGGVIGSANLLEYLQTQYITLDLKDADLDNVLRLISAQFNINIVAGEAVEGKVTVSFKDATLEGALKSMLVSNGYNYLVEGNIIRVAKQAEIAEEQKQRATNLELEGLATEVFVLRYLDASDVKKVLDPLLSARGRVTVVLRKGFKGFKFGQITSLTSSSSGSTGTSSGSSSGSSGSGASASGGTGITKSGEGGEKSTILVVQDIASSVALIKSVLREIDVQPRQILIQSRMFEVNADNLRDLGAEFGTGSSGLTSTATPPVTAVAVEKQNLGPPPEQNQTIRTLLQGGGLARFIDSSGSFGFGRNSQSGLQLRLQKLTGAQYDILLRAIQSNADFNELSGPRILVLENQEAAILVGEQFPIFQVQAPNITTNSTVESLSFFQPIGISLQVIPQIVGNDQINMVIHPSVSAIAGFVTGSTGLTAPRISIREADTQVMIGNKETLVIGGLLQDKNKETVVGIPFMMDIPLLGNLMKRKKTEVTKIELVIFITPTIVENSEFTDREKIIYERTRDKEAVKSNDPWNELAEKIKQQFMQ